MAVGSSQYISWYRCSQERVWMRRTPINKNKILVVTSFQNVIVKCCILTWGLNVSNEDMIWQAVWCLRILWKMDSLFIQCSFQSCYFKLSRVNEKLFEITDYSKWLRDKSKGNGFELKKRGIQNSRVCIYGVSTHSWFASHHWRNKMAISWIFVLLCMHTLMLGLMHLTSVHQASLKCPL